MRNTIICNKLLIEWNEISDSLAFFSLCPCKPDGTAYYIKNRVAQSSPPSLPLQGTGIVGSGSTAIRNDAGMLFYKCRCEFAIPFCGLQGTRGTECDRTLQKVSSASQYFKGREVDNADALQL